MIHKLSDKRSNRSRTSEARVKLLPRRRWRRIDNGCAAKSTARNLPKRNPSIGLVYQVVARRSLRKDSDIAVVELAYADRRKEFDNLHSVQPPLPSDGVIRLVKGLHHRKVRSVWLFPPELHGKAGNGILLEFYPWCLTQSCRMWVRAEG